MIDLLVVALLLVALCGAYRIGYSCGEADALTDLRERRL